VREPEETPAANIRIAARRMAELIPAQDMLLHYDIYAEHVADASGACPAACSGNGDCVSGACYCYKGFTGNACAERE
jgi:hypothetical protein